MPACRMLQWRRRRRSESSLETPTEGCEATPRKACGNAVEDVMQRHGRRADGAEAPERRARVDTVEGVRNAVEDVRQRHGRRAGGTITLSANARPAMSTELKKVTKP